MAYKVMDLYKDLPKTNCKECDKPGCFPFAAAVYLEGFPLNKCPYLSDEELAVIKDHLEEQKHINEDGGGEAIEQALEYLKEVIADKSFPEMAELTRMEYRPGPPEALQVELFGKSYSITKEAVFALDGRTPDIWIKVLLMIYATRGKGTTPSGKWVAMRELPNSISKAAQFEQEATKLAEAFDGKFDSLKEKIATWKGEVVSSESADLAVRFQALPCVPLLLLLWRGDEDFPARASFLLDQNILDYLDQEAIVFLSETLTVALLE